jgi:hypothetical protein
MTLADVLFLHFGGVAITFTILGMVNDDRPVKFTPTEWCSAFVWEGVLVMAILMGIRSLRE